MISLNLLVSYPDNLLLYNNSLINSCKIVKNRKMSFNGKEIKGVLCDITGVLTESVSAGGSQPIDGSIDALNRLKKAGKLLELIIYSFLVLFT